jgi:aspartyl-tRNA(Asn)/glutamyl-tRNA(Gln) amidotransferase subunit A
MIELRKKGELTSRQIVQSCLEVVEAYNEKLRAFISIDKDELLAQARKIDRQGEKKEGLLKGIPVAVKDLIDVSGQVTTAGSSFFRNAEPAKSDAPIVQRLKEAGAIIFGKTNLHEFAWGGTSENPHYGFCRNPWNPEYSAGGSSGGSGVAIAARIGARGFRHRYPWLHSPSKQLLRDCWTEAYLWPTANQRHIPLGLYL